ncbi:MULTISPECIES: motr [Methylovorus]|jgi:flagellar biosynthesis protein FlhG|uniref:MotR n=1 Tax=Methylovorus glucosotrophus (strain SIP3-4) TaxID=582744 RepID=C6XBW1_METGS|nr:MULTISPECIES: motr [Methylovorus]ACT50036.1 MotR [Methylovorus glucosotrophus SIP3-4]ADQ84008.1 MotR [Methylovorus sp. MP688]KAF0844620.1 flagellar biosynthesis protein FlhG [Methylovorus glucosotrophus]
MSSFREDQAAGLRRIMSGPRPRIVSVLSAMPGNAQARLIKNLGASIQDDGNNVIIVHATANTGDALTHYKLGNTPSLLEVANQRVPLNKAIKFSEQGYRISRLLPKQGSMQFQQAEGLQLDRIFGKLAQEYDIVLVDTVLNNNALPLQSLNDGEIVIQLTRDPESIKQAYILIKQVCSQLGRRSFGIVVSNASQAQAMLVFENIAQVARRFMQIDLEFMGAIPADEHLSRAEKLGRVVIDAFPMAQASAAFKALARKLDYRQAILAEIQRTSITL